MSAMQRRKGQQGEREAARLLTEITGQAVTRRVRQHQGDSDLIGVADWSCEIKRHAGVTHATLAEWWQQTVRQAGPHRPVLLYRQDRQPWRAVWSPTVQIVADYNATVEGSPAAWWRLVNTEFISCIG